MQSCFGDARNHFRQRVTLRPERRKLNLSTLIFQIRGRIAQRDQLSHGIFFLSQGMGDVGVLDFEHFSAANPLQDQALFLNPNDPVFFAEDFALGHTSLDADSTNFPSLFACEFLRDVSLLCVTAFAKNGETMENRYPWPGPREGARKTGKPCPCYLTGSSGQVFTLRTSSELGGRLSDIRFWKLGRDDVNFFNRGRARQKIGGLCHEGFGDASR